MKQRTEESVYNSYPRWFLPNTYSHSKNKNKQMKTPIVQGKPQESVCAPRALSIFSVSLLSLGLLGLAQSRCKPVSSHGFCFSFTCTRWSLEIGLNTSIKDTISKLKCFTHRSQVINSTCTPSHPLHLSYILQALKFFSSRTSKLTH